jgi:hypothetical protein
MNEEEYCKKKLKRIYPDMDESWINVIAKMILVVIYMEDYKEIGGGKREMKYNENFNIGLWLLILICLMSSLSFLKLHTELPDYIIYLSLFYWGINVFWEMFRIENRGKKGK